MLSYLTRRLALEKRYAVWAEVDPDRTVRPYGLAAGELPPGGSVCAVPELADLRPVCDVILVQSDGLGFQVAALRTARSDSDPLELLARLRDAGQACRRYTGSVNGVQVAVGLTLWEVYPDGLDETDKVRLRQVRHRPLGSKVLVSVLALDLRTNTAWSNLPPLIRWPRQRHATRLLEERDMSAEEQRERFAQAGFRLAPTVVAVAAGLGLALGARLGLARLGVEKGEVFACCDLVLGLSAAFVAVTARQIRRHSTTQALVTAGAYVVLLYGTLLVLGAQFGIPMLFNAALLLAASGVLGSMSEMT